MKKFIKRTTTALVVVLAILGLGGTIAYASGYITWGGTEDFNTAMENLNIISNKSKEFKGDAEYWENMYDHKEAEYQNRLEVIEVLEKEIEELKSEANVEQGQLEQAEKDMKEVREETEKTLKELE